jgi:hypothetical protein
LLPSGFGTEACIRIEVVRRTLVAAVKSDVFNITKSNVTETLAHVEFSLGIIYFVVGK